MFRISKESKSHKVIKLLTTKLKEKEEKIIEVLDNLSDESAKGTPILVEGKKDKITLRNLGIDGTILTVKSSGDSLEQTTRKIEKKGYTQIILLLDFDRTGKQTTKYLKDNFEIIKIKPNVQYWKKIFGLLRKDVQCVEGFTSYIETLRNKFFINIKRYQDKFNLKD